MKALRRWGVANKRGSGPVGALDCVIAGVPLKARIT